MDRGLETSLLRRELLEVRLDAKPIPDFKRVGAFMFIYGISPTAIEQHPYRNCLEEGI